MERTSAGGNPYLQGIADGIAGGVGLVWNFHGRNEGIERENKGKADLTKTKFPFRGIDYYKQATDLNNAKSKMPSNEVAEAWFYITSCLTVIAQVEVLRRTFDVNGLLAPVVVNLASAAVRGVETLIEISNDGLE